MDKAYIDQRQVIERYLRGTLTPDELGQFELYMLEHPEVVDDIEYARGLGDALVAAKDDLLTTAVARDRPGFFFGPRYAVAVTVVLALTSVSSVYLFQQNAALTVEMNELGGPILVPAEVWLETMRGGEPPIVEKAAAEPLLLRVATDPRAPGPYEIQIRGTDSGFSWTQSRAVAGDDGSLRIVARDLPSGVYEVTATSAAPTPVNVTYTFRLVAID
jgi:hypothetical protein